jgi:hypothetical protein
MAFREVITIISIVWNALCTQTAGRFTITAGGTYNYRRALKHWIAYQSYYEQLPVQKLTT